jgi:hypothetical protein
MLLKKAIFSPPRHFWDTATHSKQTQTLWSRDYQGVPHGPMGHQTK